MKDLIDRTISDPHAAAAQFPKRTVLVALNLEVAEYAGGVRRQVGIGQRIQTDAQQAAHTVAPDVQRGTAKRTNIYYLHRHLGQHLSKQAASSLVRNSVLHQFSISARRNADSSSITSASESTVWRTSACRAAR